MQDLEQNKTEKGIDKLTFEYVLDYKDLVSFFSQTSNFKSRGRTRIFETVLLLTVALLKAVDLTVNFSLKGVGFIAFILLVIAVLWTVPEYSIRSAARRQISDTVHRLVVSGERIVYGYGAGKKEFFPDQTTRVDELKDMFALGRTDSKTKILLPFRVISDCDIDKVREILKKYRD